MMSQVDIGSGFAEEGSALNRLYQNMVDYIVVID